VKQKQKVLSSRFSKIFLSGLDPLNTGDISVNRGFNIKLSQNQIFGFSNFKVDKIRVSLGEKSKVNLTHKTHLKSASKVLTSVLITITAGDDFIGR
jgi:hypothetical protein